MKATFPTGELHPGALLKGGTDAESLRDIVDAKLKALMDMLRGRIGYDALRSENHSDLADELTRQLEIEGFSSRVPADSRKEVERAVEGKFGQRLGRGF